ncbi:MAG: hypothetical protein FJ278_23485 [Planctomycetes bacterium]|nr:hypothetical protein [Planctomycetota bacterium]
MMHQTDVTQVVRHLVEQIGESKLREMTDAQRRRAIREATMFLAPTEYELHTVDSGLRQLLRDRALPHDMRRHGGVWR